MKKITLILLLIPCFVISQTTKKGATPLNTIYTTDYIALTVPEHYYGKIYHVDDSTKLINQKNVDSLPHDKNLLNSFPNLVSNVTVFKVEANGKLSVFGGGLSVAGETYKVIYDFSQTQTIKINGNKIDSFLVGVSVRMIASFTSKKGDINIASPFSLSANIKKLQGYLEVRVSGAASPRINDLTPTTSDLSPASIAQALQTVATVKSHIYDDDTIIIPQVLAYKKTEKKLEEEIQTLNTQKTLK